MARPDEEKFFECDETHVVFKWPRWAVSGTGDTMVKIACEIEHGSYLVSFTVTDVTTGEDREMACFDLTIDSLERLVKIARAMEGIK